MLKLLISAFILNIFFAIEGPALIRLAVLSFFQLILRFIQHFWVFLFILAFKFLLNT